jgi:hypothetical protein
LPAIGSGHSGDRKNKMRKCLRNYVEAKEEDNMWKEEDVKEREDGRRRLTLESKPAYSRGEGKG